MTLPKVPVPTQKLVVMDLVASAGVDISDWRRFKGKDPSRNPRYCFNWSFEQPGELFVLCVWHSSLTVEKGKTVYRRDREPAVRKGAGSSVWKSREAAFSRALEQAYRQSLPVRVILLEGERRNGKAAKVKRRILDPTPWAVVEYDFESGACLLVRGVAPDEYPMTPPDDELAGFEGKRRKLYVYHRHREGKLRRKKIADALQRNGGRLICEVPRCGFDFLERYGDLGKEYAQVHHTKPLKHAPPLGREVRLSELAIVCANCHAMIHRGGECRKMDELIPVNRKGS